MGKFYLEATVNSIALALRNVEQADRLRFGQQQIADALRKGYVAEAEARIAMALLLHPEIKGSRMLELASGLSRDTVLATVPPEGSSSYLLRTETRGAAIDFTREDPSGRLMTVSLKLHILDRKGGLVTSKSSLVQEEVPFFNTVENSVEEEDRKRTTDTPGLWLAVLDPAHDVWSNGAGKPGGQGWVLAMVHGFGQVELSHQQAQELLGLKYRGWIYAADRLASHGVLRRLRGKVVLSFRMLFRRMHLGDAYYDRARHKISRLASEHLLVKSRKTKAGMLARLLRKKRHEPCQGASADWTAYLNRPELWHAEAFAAALEKERSGYYCLSDEDLMCVPA